MTRPAHLRPRAPLLEVENLVVRFPARHHESVHAVDDVSFHLSAGETLGLVGESGSGKTTIGLTVLRRYSPQSGRVIFDGNDVSGRSRSELRALRRDMQMVFQDPFASLNLRMKVGDIVAEPLIVHGVMDKGSELDDRVAALLETCGLPASAAKRYPTAFSGGQRQRIAIARALALSPRLIVADEPVSALDVSIQAQIINLMLELQVEHRLSFLFISHNLPVVRHVAHRVMILYAGKVMELGTATEIFRSPIHPYTHALLSASPVVNPALERARKRIVLRGEVPSAISPPQGCRFNTRCPLAVEKCFKEQPPLVDERPGHLVACWRAGEAHELLS